MIGDAAIWGISLICRRFLSKQNRPLCVRRNFQRNKSFAYINYPSESSFKGIVYVCVCMRVRTWGGGGVEREVAKQERQLVTQTIAAVVVESYPCPKMMEHTG